MVYSTVVGFSSTIRSWITPAPNPGSHVYGESSCYLQNSRIQCEAGQPDSSTGPEDGCFLGVRVQMGNRMQDRSRHWDMRFVTLGREGLIVSTDVRDANSM